MGVLSQQLRTQSICCLTLGILLLGVGGDAAQAAEPAGGLSGPTWERLQAGIQQLAVGKAKAAERAFRDARSTGAAALPDLLLDLMRAHASQPREAPAFLDSAIDRSGDVPEPHFREVLDEMRATLAREDPAAPARQLRALLCNTRLLARDRATDGERVVLDPRTEGNSYSRPRKIFAPLAPYPPAARAAGVSRLIVMEHIIDSEGCTVKATALSIRPLGLVSPEEDTAGDTEEDVFGLGRAAANVSRWWAQEPARLDGEPIAVKYNAVVSFALR